MDAPSTDVIRHWVAWGFSSDCPDEFIDHDAKRIEQFEAWLAEVKAQAWEEGQESMKKVMSIWPKQHHLPINPYRQGENK